jgi:CDP-paratose 2-epimerase
VEYFAPRAEAVLGIDNNMRRELFGPGGDVSQNISRLSEALPNYRHFSVDIRDQRAIEEFFQANQPDLIVHAAAQPSHDLAALRPLEDFSINAIGTQNLLENTRVYAPEAVFVFLSTNKVYGDAPNKLPLVEKETRYDYAREVDFSGINEEMNIDKSMHSLFGVSKTAADLMVQEYGRYFGMKTICLRGGCLTGPKHSGVELHGFLSYLVRCAASGRMYHIYGYKGKQVRDNIHSYDIATAIEQIYYNPKCGEVYNLGGQRENSCSILEAISLAEEVCAKKMNYDYIDTPRRGDHICYISDMSKFKNDYPEWRPSRGLKTIIEEIARVSQ